MHVIKSNCYDKWSQTKWQDETSLSAGGELTLINRSCQFWIISQRWTLRGKFERHRSPWRSRGQCFSVRARRKRPRVRPCTGPPRPARRSCKTTHAMVTDVANDVHNVYLFISKLFSFILGNKKLSPALKVSPCWILLLTLSPRTVQIPTCFTRHTWCCRLRLFFVPRWMFTRKQSHSRCTYNAVTSRCVWTSMETIYTSQLKASEM